MSHLQHLLDNNSSWVSMQTERDAETFSRLANGQSPDYLWIACSDSRMPTTSQVGLGRGDMFVHRNIANQVKLTDTSTQAAIEFAVKYLGVKDIVVCGHYGCGGIAKAIAMQGAAADKIDEWVLPIRALYETNAADLDKLDDDARLQRLCELNVAKQVENISLHETVQAAWQNNVPLAIHGLVYDLATGYLRDLDLTRKA
ncbi:MAG: carbonic anhydrase [Pseudomonadales bacterium]|nr:carbonic anhydrase [Pseudomonadales bacterium]